MEEDTEGREGGNCQAMIGEPILHARRDNYPSVLSAPGRLDTFSQSNLFSGQCIKKKEEGRNYVSMTSWKIFLPETTPPMQYKYHLTYHR